MALTQRPRECTRVWPTTVAAIALLVALLVLPLALAPRAEAYIFWTRTIDHSIGRANLDGTAIDESFIDLRHHAGPTSVAVDAQHIYWLSWLPYGTRSGSARVRRLLPGAISRARLDGTRVDVDFITGFDAHSGTGMSGGALVAVDDEHIYWTETFYGDFGIYQAAIARANLDGTGVEKTRLPCGRGHRRGQQLHLLDRRQRHWPRRDRWDAGRAGLHPRPRADQQPAGNAGPGRGRRRARLLA